MLKFDQKAYREINLDKRQFRHKRLAEVRYSLYLAEQPPPSAFSNYLLCK